MVLVLVQREALDIRTVLVQGQQRQYRFTDLRAIQVSATRQQYRDVQNLGHGSPQTWTYSMRLYGLYGRWAVGSVIRVSQWIVSAVRDAPREWNIRGNAV